MIEKEVGENEFFCPLFEYWCMDPGPGHTPRQIDVDGRPWETEVNKVKCVLRVTQHYLAK